MRTLMILLVIAGMLAGWLLLQQNRREKEEHFWMTELETRLNYLKSSHSTVELEPREAPMFKLILFMHEAEAANVDLAKMINDTCADLNYDDTASTVILESIMQDFNAAKHFGIFDDPTNLMQLEHGETAVIRAPGWKGEKLAVAQIVPGVLAPEVAQSLPNLVLVPTIVRDAWSDAVTPSVVERARVLERTHFMSRETLDRVVAASKPTERPRSF